MGNMTLKVKHWLESYGWEQYAQVGTSSRKYWKHYEHGRGFEWDEAVAVQVVENSTANHGHQSSDGGD